MSALCAGRRLCSAALWCMPPPAGRARNLLKRRIQGQLQHCINSYSDDAKEGHRGEGQAEAPRSTSALGIRRRRSLSPLERVSGIIPPEFISQEIRDLQNPEHPSSSQNHLGTLRPPLSSQDHLGTLRPPSSSQDHLGTLRPPSSSQDHLGELRPPSSSQDHLGELRPPSSSQDHLGTLRHPSSSQDHLEQLRLSSSSQDHLGELRPPSSSQDHLGELRPSSSSQDHLGELRPSLSSQDHPGELRPSLSSQDHPRELRPSSSKNYLKRLTPSSSSQNHLGELRPSSSSQDHLGELRPSSSFQDHIGELRPSSSSQDHLGELRHSSSSQDHLEQLRALSSHQESRHGSPKQLPFPSIQENNASRDLHSLPKSSPPQDLAPSQGIPFQPGDLLIAEYKRRHYTMFRKMFVLKNSGKLISNWGAINNKHLLGKLPGEKIQTSTGYQLFVRRAPLDEYAIYMKRGPTIAYPKDIASMLIMMDVNPGDVILEAGSGSGALSLFLSRAVGPEGRVLSVEVRSDHHRISKSNFLTWKTAWEIRSGRCWPDNVTFINKDIVDAVSDLKSVAFDAVALDMLNPHVALSAIIGNLKQGAVCAVYIANITQVINLLEAIRLCELSLLCEKVMEVNITDWLVCPSLRKDGSVSMTVKPHSEAQTQEQADDDGDGNDGDGGDDDDEGQRDDDPVLGSRPFGQVPYIARPKPWQAGHTAFLVQLRKFKAA